MKNAHKPIIDKKMYDRVQAEMLCRIITEVVNGITNRIYTNYCS